MTLNFDYPASTQLLLELLVCAPWIVFWDATNWTQGFEHASNRYHFPYTPESENKSYLLFQGAVVLGEESVLPHLTDFQMQILFVHKMYNLGSWEQMVRLTASLQEKWTEVGWCVSNTR